MPAASLGIVALTEEPEALAVVVPLGWAGHFVSSILIERNTAAAEMPDPAGGASVR